MRIYYFSGTGNSLHVSRELARRIPGTELIPMLGALKHERPAKVPEVVGLVFPIHCLGLPITVMEFLKKTDFSPASYIFALATRECSSMVFSGINWLLSRQKKALSASFSVQMSETYLPVFEVSSKEEVEDMEEKMLNRLGEIVDLVKGRQSSLQRDKKNPLFLLYYLLAPVIRFIMVGSRYFNLEKKFFATEACTGCGLCAQVCLSDKIRLEAGKPVWDGATPCLFCFACIHYCPAAAIQIRKSKTAIRGRYHHPVVSAQDIAEQKHG